MKFFPRVPRLVNAPHKRSSSSDLSEISIDPGSGPVETFGTIDSLIMVEDSLPNIATKSKTDTLKPIDLRKTGLFEHKKQVETIIKYIHHLMSRPIQPSIHTLLTINRVILPLLDPLVLDYNPITLLSSQNAFFPLFKFLIRRYPLSLR